MKFGRSLAEMLIIRFGGILMETSVKFGGISADMMAIKFGGILAEMSAVKFGGISVEMAAVNSASE